ncbi:MAG: hypothetical protein GJU76_02530 [Gallionella sp.]|jgi:hypothetical protein|nr:hypothetical protein [Gallionella sp.]
MELETIDSPRYLDDHAHIEVNIAGECFVIYARCALQPYGYGSFTIALSVTDEEGEQIPPSDEQLREFVTRAAQHLEQMQIALRLLDQFEDEGNDAAWQSASAAANLIGDELARVARDMGMCVDNY